MFVHEDFPCCGCQYGECEDRPEFHSEYWYKVLENEDPDYPIDYDERY